MSGTPSGRAAEKKLKSQDPFQLLLSWFAAERWRKTEPLLENVYQLSSVDEPSKSAVLKAVLVLFSEAVHTLVRASPWLPESRMAWRAAVITLQTTSPDVGVPTPKQPPERM